MSSRKVPEVIFQACGVDGELVFSNPQDLTGFLMEHPEEVLLVHIELEAQTSAKMRMYAYYYRVILPCAVIGYTTAGYEGIDNVHADYLLRAEFAKDYIKKGNDYVPIVLDKRNMTKPRLHKYMSDCIFFIENQLQQRVPDSEEYKINKQHGGNFQTVK